VDDGLRTRLAEGGVHRRFVADVGGDEAHSFALERLDGAALEAFRVEGVEVVDGGHLVAAPEEAGAQMRSDEPRASRDEDAHLCHLPQRRGALAPAALPELEHGQSPERLAQVGLAAKVAAEEVLRVPRLEQSASAQLAVAEELLEERPQRTADPGGDGDAEPFLRP
jgi:hypothetical protein